MAAKTMKTYLVALAVMLAGCAVDRYSVIPNSAGRADLMVTDLRACKQQAIHGYFENRHHVGVVIGGLLGGAVGGAIGGALDSSDEDRPNIDTLIERCMKERGYEGTSRG